MKSKAQKRGIMDDMKKKYVANYQTARTKFEKQAAGQAKTTRQRLGEPLKLRDSVGEATQEEDMTGQTLDDTTDDTASEGYSRRRKRDNDRKKGKEQGEREARKMARKKVGYALMRNTEGVSKRFAVPHGHQTVLSLHGRWGKALGRLLNKKVQDHKCIQSVTLSQSLRFSSATGKAFGKNGRGLAGDAQVLEARFVLKHDCGGKRRRLKDALGTGGRRRRRRRTQSKPPPKDQNTCIMVALMDVTKKKLASSARKSAMVGEATEVHGRRRRRRRRRRSRKRRRVFLRRRRSRKRRSRKRRRSRRSRKRRRSRHGRRSASKPTKPDKRSKTLIQSYAFVGTAWNTGRYGGEKMPRIGWGNEEEALGEAQPDQTHGYQFQVGDALQDTSSVGYKSKKKARNRVKGARKDALKKLIPIIQKADRACQTSQNVLLIDPVVRDALAELRFDIAKEL